MVTKALENFNSERGLESAPMNIGRYVPERRTKADRKLALLHRLGRERGLLRRRYEEIRRCGG
jgi:hypothetical protein